MSMDSEEIVDTLERIEQAIGSLEKAVTTNSAGSVVAELFKLVVYLICFATGLHYFDAAWHSSWRYAAQYSVNRSVVHIEKEPHDCDFLAAPVGEKYCQYEIEVATLRWAQSTSGNPIYSTDGGKTWSIFTPDDGVKVPTRPTIEEVNIDWNKKDADFW